MRPVLAIIAAPALSAGPLLSDEDDVGGFYLGMGLGDFSTGIDASRDVDEANFDFDADQNARKLFAGWRFNRFVAVQIDRVDFERGVDARNALNVISTQADGFAPSLV